MGSTSKSHKKSKRKSKKSSSRESKSKASGRSEQHINPFQIESDQQQWEGDYYWNDEEDEEQAGLLVGSYESRQHEPPSSSFSSRILCMFASAVFVFWILLASTAQNSTTTTTPKDDDDHHEASIPTGSFSAPHGVVSPTMMPSFQKIESTLSPTDARIEETTRSPTMKEATDSTPLPTPSIDENSTDSFPFHTTTTTYNTTEEEEDDEWSQQHIRHKPHYFIVLGERHSGVEWMTKQLKQNCGNQNQHPVTFGFRRPGYWFQTSSSSHMNTDGAPLLEKDEEFMTKVKLHYTPVIVVMIRNPIDWFRALYQQPEYALEMAENSTSLHDFLTAPWGEATAPYNNNTECQLGFGPHQVIPCLPVSTTTSTATPVYELSSTGTIFPNIAALRAAKMRHWKQFLPRYWGVENDGVVWVPVEEKVWNITSSCQLSVTSPIVPPLNSTISKGYRLWLDATVDWKLEEEIGYSQSTTTGL